MHAGGAIKTTTGVTIMSDIISELAGQFGIPSAQADSAAGSVLKFVQTEAGSGDFQQLLAAAPQIQGWIAKAGQGAAASGGGGLQIGIARWRERVCRYVKISGCAVSLKKKNNIKSRNRR